MRLYLVRHGQTDANLAGFALHADDNAPLNPTGRAQATAAAGLLRALEPKVDLIASSPYTRTQQTAKIIAEAYNLPFFVQNELKEANFDGLQGKTIDEVYEKLQKDQNSAYRTNVPGDFESWSMIASRMTDLAEKLRAAKWQSVVLVSHSLPIHIAVTKLTSTAVGDRADIQQDFATGSVSRLVYQNGAWKIDFLNRTTH